MAADAPAPVPAATIMMLRDGPRGLEVFMVVRHHEIDFASGALVFPGGKVDDTDFDEALLPHLDSPHTDAAMRATHVAAIREAFEESGILLARPEAGGRLVDADRLRALEPYRAALNDREVTITEFLQKEDLRLACDQLVPFSHWITPAMVPKRFDTHFFLAAAPADHLAVHDGSESVDSEWVRPADALADAESGKRTVIFPTLRNIEKLGRRNTVADAIAAASADEIVPILPELEQRDDGAWLVIPKNAGYDVTELKMPDRQR